MFVCVMVFPKPEGHAKSVSVVSVQTEAREFAIVEGWDLFNILGNAHDTVSI